MNNTIGHSSDGEKVVGSLQPDQGPTVPYLLEANLAISSKFPSLRLLFSGHGDPTPQPNWVPSQPSSGTEGTHQLGKTQSVLAVKVAEVMRTDFGSNGRCLTHASAAIFCSIEVAKETREKTRQNFEPCMFQGTQVSFKST